MAVELDTPMKRLLVTKGNKLAAPPVQQCWAGLSISVLWIDPVQLAPAMATMLGWPKFANS